MRGKYRLLAGAVLGILLAGFVPAPLFMFTARSHQRDLQAARIKQRPVGKRGAQAAAAAVEAGTATAATPSTSSPVTVPDAASDRPIIPPDSFDAPPPPPAPVPPELAAQAAIPPGPPGSVWAVLVGINDYPGQRSDLAWSVADADVMERALHAARVPASNIVVLRDHQATAGNIVQAVDWLSDKASRGTTGVLFYAGHVRKVADNTEAFVAADGRLVTDQQLGAGLSDMGSSDAWVVIAGCYGGGFTEVLAPGRLLTAASDANSLAYENDSLQHSYLGEYLVRRGLLGGEAGSPTAHDAFAFAQRALARDYPHRQLTQVDESDGFVSVTPEQGDGSGAGSGSESPSSPPPSSPPPSQAPPPPSSEPCRNPFGLLCPSGQSVD